MENPKTTLFVDMDGVLAKFFEDPQALAHYRDPGYFLSLKPYGELTAALKRLRKEKNLNIIILSAVDPDCCIPVMRLTEPASSGPVDGSPFSVAAQKPSTTAWLMPLGYSSRKREYYVRRIQYGISHQPD